jgi:hypothetical protein
VITESSHRELRSHCIFLQLSGRSRRRSHQLSPVHCIGGFRFDDGVKGAASAITVQVAFDCSDMTVGTSNYAFRGQVSAGANKLNLNMSGTADNFLEGKVKFGATGIAANNAQTVTVGNVGPGAAGIAILEWASVKNASGTTRYIPLFG